jgi:putative DNA primase/helicase
MRPHRLEDFCTKMTAVAPAPARTGCPKWKKFLKRAQQGDKEPIAFLQRVSGYGLTGFTHEHQLFFLYGTGRNGKGVCGRTIAGIMAKYAVTAPMETFTATNHTQHPTELAMLQGARLVTAQETEEGRRWAEARIKSMTGGDRITARFMRQDFFSFDPQFKLLIVGNHKPSLRGVDEAMRARMNFIPFSVTIPEKDRDKQLTEKLKQEWPAILRWMIDGCLKWQKKGLCPPAAVRAATEEYLAEEDAVSTWFGECCERDGSGRENTADLYRSWKGWAEGAGEFIGSMKRLNQALQARGFEPKREPGTGRSGFKGIQLLPRDDTDDMRNGG